MYSDLLILLITYFITLIFIDDDAEVLKLNIFRYSSISLKSLVITFISSFFVLFIFLDVLGLFI
jgi:hypothetical protein